MSINTLAHAEAKATPTPAPALAPLTPALTPARPGLLQRKCACGGTPGVDGECAECRAKRLGVQRQAASLSAPTAVPPIVHDVLNSPGKQLDDKTRAFMEPRFGHDFSQVRVHSDARAAESARAVNALAYTIGRDVVFGEGQYAAGTSAGQRLLAHELTHVVQQAQAVSKRARWANNLQINSAGDVLEREADIQASIVMQGNKSHQVQRKAPENLIQLQPSHRPTPPPTPHPTVFHPGVAHHHRPTHNWPAIQAPLRRRCERQISQRTITPRSPIECICAFGSPREVLEAARFGTMTLVGLTLASQHLDHYLDGHGADFHEDLESVLMQDAGVRSVLARAIRRHSQGHVRIEQSDYANRDFQFAFGAIDRLDYEVIRATHQVHVWFQDRYEWHPEDTSRPSNCVHKAAVELQDEGAQDYWMIGEATVPLKLVTGSSSPSGPEINF